MERSVCDFDAFYGSPPRQIPQGWQPFIIYGDLTYMQDVDTFFGPPSLRMWSNGGTFKAGISTQVRVTPGNGYRASIAWGGPNDPDNFGRQLGIDPTGGTDPNSPSVIWGPMHFGPGRFLNYPPGEGPNIDVKARAASDTVTVFFVVDHPRSTGDNLIYVDAIALYPDESAQGLPAPVPTAVPAAAPVVQAAAVQQSVVVLPTATPFPTATPTETPHGYPIAYADHHAHLDALAHCDGRERRGQWRAGKFCRRRSRGVDFDWAGYRAAESVADRADGAEQCGAVGGFAALATETSKRVGRTGSPPYSIVTDGLPIRPTRITARPPSRKSPSMRRPAQAGQ
jgi:hypothetical protein